MGDYEKAEILCEHFASVFTVDNNRPPPVLSPSRGVLSEIHFDLMDVFGPLRKESVKVSMGPDGILHVAYRKLCASIALPLSYFQRQPVRRDCP